MTRHERFLAEPDDEKIRAEPTGSLLTRVLRDPLVHFLALGGLILAIYGALNPSAFSTSDDVRITVSKDRLLTFLQYRNKAFEPVMAEARLAALGPHDLKQLIDDFVEEEALYREAKALGLDRQDYVIKRRMVQRLEFLAGDINNANGIISEDRLRDYFRQNEERFATAPSYTFTHVFISREGNSPAAVMALAKMRIKDLNSKRANFSEAPSFGDRFPFGVNFVEATQEQIDSQFGEGFARQLAALQVENATWQGPLTSEFGAHIVMLVAKTRPTKPRFEDVRDQVAAELAQVDTRNEADKALAQIVARYPVDMRFEDPRLANGENPE